MLFQKLHPYDGPSAEVISTKWEQMAHSNGTSDIHKNIVIKIPMCEEGLIAVSVLEEKR